MKTFHTFLRCFAFYYFEGNTILRFLINLRPPKNRFSQGTVFSYLPVFLIIFMQTVCAFPSYFTLIVFRFSWLRVDYYKYLPRDFMDCFAITFTLNTVMTKTRNIVFSKAILILTNKRKSQGISYDICYCRLYACLVFLRTVKQVNLAPRKAILALTLEVR